MSSLRQDTPDEKPPGHPRTPHRSSVDAEVKQDNHGRDLSGGASQHFGGISTAWTSVTGDSVTGGMYSNIKNNFKRNESESVITIHCQNYKHISKS